MRRASLVQLKCLRNIREACKNSWISWHQTQEKDLAQDLGLGDIT